MKADLVWMRVSDCVSDNLINQGITPDILSLEVQCQIFCKAAQCCIVTWRLVKSFNANLAIWNWITTLKAEHFILRLLPFQLHSHDTCQIWLQQPLSVTQPCKKGAPQKKPDKKMTDLSKRNKYLFLLKKNINKDQ